MKPKKITYGGMRARQKDDLKKNVMNFHVYRWFSTPFTYIFVKLGISPNAITISSSLLCLASFYFLSLGSYLHMLIGLLFLALFKVFDMSDGEVARIQGRTSIEGIFFDRLTHYVFGISVGLGFGIGLYRMHQNEIYIILGFVLSLALILENAVRDLIRLFLAQGAKKPQKSGASIRDIDSTTRQKFLDSLYSGRSWKQNNIFSRVFGIFPFQGIIYSESIMIPVLMLLIAAEYFFSSVGIVPEFFGAGISVAYLLVVAVSKSILVVSYAYRIEKDRLISKTLGRL